MSTKNNKPEHCLDPEIEIGSLVSYKKRWRNTIFRVENLSPLLLQELDEHGEITGGRVMPSPFNYQYIELYRN